MFRVTAKTSVFILSLIFLAACGKPPEPAPRASTLSEQEKDVLVQYDAVRGRLADDDLPGAKEAANALADIALAVKGRVEGMEAPSRKLAQAENLKDARIIFTEVSAAAIAVAKGEPGYYVMECGMFDKGDWVQTETRLANPYMGKAMLECGTIKKN